MAFHKNTIETSKFLHQYSITIFSQGSKNQKKCIKQRNPQLTTDNKLTQTQCKYVQQTIGRDVLAAVRDTHYCTLVHGSDVSRFPRGVSERR